MGLHEHEGRGFDTGYDDHRPKASLQHHRHQMIYRVSWVVVVFVTIAIAWRLVF